MSNSEIPLFQRAFYAPDDVRIYLNSKSKYINLVYKSVGEKLINRVDPETGEILYLQGTADEISAAYEEMKNRIDKMSEYLQQRK